MNASNIICQGNHSTACDPWKTRKFNSQLSKSKESCPHCLPDCEKMTYSVTHTAARFRKCDSRNLNLAPFCKLTAEKEPNKLNRWLPAVLSQYNKSQNTEPFPDYLDRPTNERSTYPGETADGELLEELTKEDSTYDAFADDIAVLNLYYGDPEFPGNS